MHEEFPPGQLRALATEALDSFSKLQCEYLEWRSGTEPEKLDIKAVYCDTKGQVKKLFVIVGPSGYEKNKTVVELPIPPSGWAAYRIVQTVDDVVLDVLEPNRFKAEQTLSDDMESPTDYRRREYRDGQLEMLLGLANNDAIKGRPVTSSEAKNLFDALKKVLTRYL